MKITSDQKLIIILILFSAALFFMGLGRMALTDPDEVFYAETAKEMHERGGFLTPYIFGEPQFEKPPFYYWLVMFGFKAFGVNEFSARIASAIFGIIGIVGIYFLGKILVNRRTGFLAGIILATSVEYLVLSRACVTDIVLCVFILYGFLFFFYKRYFLSAVSLGLAVLTKGPVGVFLPVLIIAIYLIFTKGLKRVKEMPLVGGAILFLAVCLPWYLLMYKAHGKEFIDMFFGFHNIIRFLHPEHRIGDVFYYYFPVVLGGFFPWSIFLPLGIWQAFREREEKTRRVNLFLAIWVLVVFIFFSMSRTKLPTYIFPMYPALALLMGYFLDSFLSGGLTGRQKKTAAFLTGMLFVSLAGGIIAFLFLSKIKYPTILNATLLSGILFIALLFISASMIFRKKYTAGLAAYMVSFIALILLVSYFVSPDLGKYEASKDVSQKLLTLAKPDEEIGAETQYRRGVAFYTGREDIPDVHPHHIMTKFLAKKERMWAVIKEKNYDQLYEDSKKPFDKPSYIVYRMGKKVIVTNKVPPGGKFLKMRNKNVIR